jgi:tripartite-type tricarboxylate transporter receptor subunit TctC
MPEVKEKLDNLSVDIMKMSPQEFDALVQKDIVKWNAAVKASGATVD